jgi:hypothetical protein
MGLLCPSSNCHDGAILLGIVLPGGRVAFAQDRIIVDAGFVRNAVTGDHAPETRFRFGSPCAAGGCRQWTGSRCGVIDSVLKETSEQLTLGERTTSLPACSIRPDCRWFDQAGAAACEVCDVVVTDTRGE